MKAQIRKINSLKHIYIYFQNIFLASNCFYVDSIHKILEHKKGQRPELWIVS